MSEPSYPRCEFESNRLILRLELVISADVAAVDSIADRILGFVQDMECAKGKEFEIETSLREALVNAIVHGCEKDPGKQVQVCVACDDERGVLIVVRDPGPGFDPAALPSPLVGENIYSEHGRGIYLINQLMDEVHFRRGGTEIVMRKR